MRGFHRPTIQQKQQQYLCTYSNNTQTGVKGTPTALLLTDGQIVSERFLVWLHNLLAQGHVADLCGVEERDAFVSAVRTEAKAAGVMDTPDTLWQFFIAKVCTYAGRCLDADSFAFPSPSHPCNHGCVAHVILPPDVFRICPAPHTHTIVFELPMHRSSKT